MRMLTRSLSHGARRYRKQRRAVGVDVSAVANTLASYENCRPTRKAIIKIMQLP